MFRVLEFRVIKVLSVDLRDFVPGGATLLHRCVKHACEEVFYLQNIFRFRDSAHCETG